MKKNTALFVLAIGMLFGISDVVLADAFSNPMTTDQYNGNELNHIPTPYFTPGLNYNLFDAANLLHPGYGFTANEDLDTRLYLTDHSWTNTAGSQLSFYVLGNSAKNISNLGYYARTQNNDIIKSSALLTGVSGFGFVGDGQSAATGFTGLNFVPFNKTFGWYIETTDWHTGVVSSYYSEAQLNPDGFDHLITYALPELKGTKIYTKGVSTPHTFTENAYLIGFKDRPWGDYSSSYDNWPFVGTLGDDDFNDIMILVDSSIIKPTDNPPLVPEPATMTLMAAGLSALFLYGRRSRS